MESDSENQARLSTYLVCLWRNHPFGNQPNVIAKQIEANLRKLLHLNELLKLSLELVQYMSMVSEKNVSFVSRCALSVQ